MQLNFATQTNWKLNAINRYTRKKRKEKCISVLARRKRQRQKCVPVQVHTLLYWYNVSVPKLELVLATNKSTTLQSIFLTNLRPKFEIYIWPFCHNIRIRQEIHCVLGEHNIIVHWLQLRTITHVQIYNYKECHQ